MCVFQPAVVIDVKGVNRLCRVRMYVVLVGSQVTNKSSG